MIATELGVRHELVSRAVAKISGDLGEVEKYRFQSTKIAPGYTPEQRKMIKQYLKESGRLSGPPPEGRISRKAMARQFGVSGKRVGEVIDELGDELGATEIHIFGGQKLPSYDQAQQQKIKERLEAKGLIADPAPEGILSTDGIAKLFGVNHQPVDNAVKKLGGELGVVKKYKFSSGSTITNGFDIDQQMMIDAVLYHSGIFASPAPEGVLSVRGVMGTLHASEDRVKHAIRELGEALGPVELYKFGGTRLAPGYTQPQQQEIKRYLAKE